MANKKSKALIVLSFLLIALLVQFSLVEALTWGGAVDWVKKNILGYVFGFKPETPIEVTVIWFVLFIMFFFAFSDIIRTFTLFSPTVSYILGFGLAIITATTRATFYLAVGIFALVGGIGVLAVAVAVGTAFVAFLALHWGTGWLHDWIVRRRFLLEAHRKGAEVEAGLEVAAEIGRWAARGA
jgi:hypothetical protein